MNRRTGLNIATLDQTKDDIQRRVQAGADPEDALAALIEQQTTPAPPEAAAPATELEATPEPVAPVRQQGEAPKRSRKPKPAEPPAPEPEEEPAEDRRVSMTIWISPEHKTMARTVAKRYRDEDDNGLSLGEFFELAIEDAYKKLEKKYGRKFRPYHGQLKKGPPVR